MRFVNYDERSPEVFWPLHWQVNSGHRHDLRATDK
jgi:hypothetical protein